MAERWSPGARRRARVARFTWRRLPFVMDTLQLDVEVTRGETIESRHRVHAAVVGANDALIGGGRDHGLVTM